MLRKYWGRPFYRQQQQEQDNPTPITKTMRYAFTPSVRMVTESKPDWWDDNSDGEFTPSTYKELDITPNVDFIHEIINTAQLVTSDINGNDIAPVLIDTAEYQRIRNVAGNAEIETPTTFFAKYDKTIDQVSKAGIYANPYRLMFKTLQNPNVSTVSLSSYPTISNSEYIAYLQSIDKENMRYIDSDSSTFAYVLEHGLLDVTYKEAILYSCRSIFGEATDWDDYTKYGWSEDDFATAPIFNIIVDDKANFFDLYAYQGNTIVDPFIRLVPSADVGRSLYMAVAGYDEDVTIEGSVGDDLQDRIEYLTGGFDADFYPRPIGGEASLGNINVKFKWYTQTFSYAGLTYNIVTDESTSRKLVGEITSSEQKLKFVYDLDNGGRITSVIVNNI